MPGVVQDGAVRLEDTDSRDEVTQSGVCFLQRVSVQAAAIAYINNDAVRQRAPFTAFSEQLAAPLGHSDATYVSRVHHDSHGLASPAVRWPRLQHIHPLGSLANYSGQSRQFAWSLDVQVTAVRPEHLHHVAASQHIDVQHHTLRHIVLFHALREDHDGGDHLHAGPQRDGDALQLHHVQTLHTKLQAHRLYPGWFFTSNETKTLCLVIIHHRYVGAAVQHHVIKPCPHLETLFGNNVSQLFGNCFQTVEKQCFPNVSQLFPNSLETVSKLFGNC